MFNHCRVKSTKLKFRARRSDEGLTLKTSSLCFPYGDDQAFQPRDDKNIYLIFNIFYTRLVVIEQSLHS